MREPGENPLGKFLPKEGSKEGGPKEAVCPKGGGLEEKRPGGFIGGYWT